MRSRFNREKIDMEVHPYGTAQEAVVDGGEGTTKYAKGAKREVDPLLGTFA